MPYLAGTSTSARQPAAAPTAIVVVTKRAPGNASRRSVCGTNSSSAPRSTAILRPTRAMVSAASPFRSTRWTVQPSNVRVDARSVISPGVNTVLPAPIRTMDFSLTDFPFRKSVSLGAAGQQAVDDVAVERQRQRSRDDDRQYPGRVQQGRRDHVPSLQRGDDDGQRLRGQIAGQHEREQELAPGEQEGDQGGGDDA